MCAFVSSVAVVRGRIATPTGGTPLDILRTYLHFDQTCLPSLDNGYRPRGSTACNYSGAKEMCDTDSVLAFDKREGKLSTDGIATTPTLLHSSNHTFAVRDSGLTCQGRER